MMTRSALTTMLAGCALAACGGGKNNATIDAGTVFGSAKISWAITNAHMMPVACQDLGLSSASVSIGSTPMEVSCGSDQSVVFDSLVPQNYPVLVELIKGGATFDQKPGNVLVQAGQQASVTITFVENVNQANKGKITVNWTINGQPPAIGCENSGASTVHVETLPGSIADFAIDAPCTAGTLTSSSVAAGSYGLKLTLESAGMHALVSTLIDRVDVMSGQTATPPTVDFFLGNDTYAHFIGRWTINSTTATTACPRVNGEHVEITAYPMGTVVPTFTASAACARGKLVVPQVPPGIMPHHVVFKLFAGPPVPMELALTSTDGIVFPRNQTSTVSVNFHVMR
jgi:hypothetical protein